MDTTRRLVYDLDLPELKNQVEAWGQPAYRAVQIWQGLYKQLWPAAELFTNLPESLRLQLGDQFYFTALTPGQVLQSIDRETTKTLFTLNDNRAIEAVLMKYNERRTLCISTQAGCALGCIFCATGQMGFKRNLTSGEIVEQVLYYARLSKMEGEHITNIVVMGMGEPFHNYDATMSAINRLNNPQGMMLGERRFTISTVGLVPMIRKFAEEKRQINLAISLHAANDSLRSKLLPVNRKYPIAELITACREYVEKTKRRLTFEWALIYDVNDSINDARELTNLLSGLLCHVNVIPLNPTHRYAGQATTRQRANEFRNTVMEAGIPCTIRLRRGIDIEAGCGQLAIEANPAP